MYPKTAFVGPLSRPCRTTRQFLTPSQANGGGGKRELRTGGTDQECGGQTSVARGGGGGGGEGGERTVAKRIESGIPLLLLPLPRAYSAAAERGIL